MLCRTALLGTLAAAAVAAGVTIPVPATVPHTSGG
jgi:hypothetical protein